MDHSDLRTLVDFHYWARNRMLAAVEPLSAEQYTRDLGNSFKSVRDTLVHMYSAEWVWYTRWQGTSPTSPIPFDKFADLAALTAAWRDLEAQVRSFVDGLEAAAVGRPFDYRMMNGQAVRSVFWQMLQHVVNHGTYHRGQVVTMLRQLGLPAPKSTDLIMFYRER
ncbi:MAG TPA: DinB family protein [Vicinamibacterales bacterium]|nr:DinB family protein [Vicinamibacterales bacterium]